MSCFSPRLVTRACRKPSSATRSAAISGASIAGGLNSQPWVRRRAAAQAGCCSLGRRAIASSSINGPWTTPLAGATPILALDMLRALVSHGLRRESGRLCRCVHGGDQLAKRRACLRRIASVSLYSRPHIRSAELRSGRVRATVAFKNALATLAREVVDQRGRPPALCGALFAVASL